MTHLRVFIAAALLATACISVNFIWAAARSPEQQKAASKCDAKFQEDDLRCLREHPELSAGECASAAAKGWRACMDKAGLRENLHPPKAPTTRPTNPVTGVSSGSPTATPKPLHHQLDTSTQTNVTIKSTSPTPSPKPKAGRTPHHTN
jgi:hypothetical protein